MKSKTGIIIGGIILGILCAFLFFMGGRALFAWITKEDPATETEEKVTEEELSDDGMLKIQDGKRTNVLLLGIDARAGEEEARTDSMIFVSVDPELKKAVIISIPRDTRVTINGSKDQKICAANVYGGAELAKKKVEELLHTHVDYYAKANFEGFEEIIDILGGVTIDVEERMYHPSANPLENIDLQKGVQTLNGQQALSFVRYRSYAMGDIDRTTHQQKFLKAVVEKVTQPATLLKIPKLLDVIKENLKTDMPMGTIIQMASWAPLFESQNVVTQTLPGYFLDIRDSAGHLLNSFWAADEKIAPHLLNDLYQGKTYDTVNQVGGVTEVVGGGSAAQPAAVEPEETVLPSEEEVGNESQIGENGEILDQSGDVSPLGNEEIPLPLEGEEPPVQPTENVEPTPETEGGTPENPLPEPQPVPMESVDMTPEPVAEPVEMQPGEPMQENIQP